MVLLEDMEGKQMVVLKTRLSIIVESVISLFTFLKWDLFRITCSILKHLEDL
jgi:hypothetical protein